MKSKKGSELTLQTIVTFAILIIVLVIMIYFFANHYGGNADTLVDVGSSAIDNAQNS